MEWQPIETATHEHDNNLIFADRHKNVGEGYWDDYRGRWMWATGDYVEPTHWMPLPEPPQ